MKPARIEDFGRPARQLTHVEPGELMPLPPPYDRLADQPGWKQLPEKTRGEIETSLDDTVAVGMPRPVTPEQEQALVERFLAGLAKLFQRENNWTFLQPLLLSLEHCAGCQTCSEACPIYLGSGRTDIYRPTFRSDIWRRLVHKYLKPGGRLFGRLAHGEIELNWTTVARLMELAYRCTLCRRCAQACPIGVDNGLIAHELRKVFSQELGIAAKELHQQGALLQLQVGSSTGMTPPVVRDNIEFIDDDMTECTGLRVRTPWDVHGADVLLIHNAGEIMSWPENPGAFALLLQQAGISWTMSSELVAYDGINYGLWYDDVLLAKVAVRHAQAARRLGVKRIVIGECGHAHKALAVVADRVLLGDLNVPRVSALALLEQIVFSGRIKFDPARNNFPVTLHDPCNLVRLMGIVEPQRRVLRYLCPQFREMEPHGVDNYCCGGGSGFAIMSGHNFMDWRLSVSGRMKLKQIVEAFADCPSPAVKKYVCAPCSNCKGQIRDLFRYYGVYDKSGIVYGGLAELIVNAMADVQPPFINLDEAQ